MTSAIKTLKRTSIYDLLALNFRYCAFILCCGEETDVRKLPHRDLDLFDSLVRIILDVNVDGDFLPMIV